MARHFLTGAELSAAELNALLDRALEYAAGLASQPRWMLLETKRRILLDAEASVGALAAQEDRALRGALLDLLATGDVERTTRAVARGLDDATAGG